MLSRFFLPAYLLVSTALAAVSPDWVLVFEDTFKESKINTKKWSLIPYEEGASHIAWRRYQSRDKDFFRFTGKPLQLRGDFGEHRSQSNPDTPQQTYACAGIWSRDSFSFRHGKVEVKARFDGVQGCWPAIWLMPTNGEGWPKSGEIDLMEHLNNEAGVYQTVHFRQYHERQKQRARDESGCSALPQLSPRNAAHTLIYCLDIRQVSR